MGTAGTVIILQTFGDMAERLQAPPPSLELCEPRSCHSLLMGGLVQKCTLKGCFRHGAHCCVGFVSLEVFPCLVKSQNTGNLLLARGGLSFFMLGGKQESWLLMTECRLTGANGGTWFIGERDPAAQEEGEVHLAS